MTRRAFGPAVFLCLLWATTVAWNAEPRQISVCAYNLRNWLSMERLDGRNTMAVAPKPESERERVVKTLSEIRPDVLGVCEIGTRDDLADFQKRLAVQGLDLPHVEFAHGGDPTRSLALLSRFPISERLSQTDLNYQIGPTTFPMQRGILDAVVAFNPALQVRFIGVHLKSKRPIPEADETLMRRNEAHLLRKHLDSILASDQKAKVVCYGDFNEHRNESAIAAIVGNRSDDGYMADVPMSDLHGEVWTHFWDAADTYSRFDYFFVSRALRPLIDTRQTYIFANRDFAKASDHRPIVLTLKIGAPASAAKK